MYQSAQLWTEFYRRLDDAARRLTDPSTGMVAEEYSRTVPCPVCDSSSFRLRVQKLGFTYVTCMDCSFVYLNPQLTQTALERVYNDQEVRTFFFRELLLPFVENDQQAEFERRLNILRTLVPGTTPSLLDVGCAAGKFLTLASRGGFRGEGLELNGMYVEYVRKHRGDIVVHQRLLEDMKYPDSRFDAVVLWDVLEHLPRPLETLRHIHRVTSASGILALTTISHASINEMILKEHWRYYMPPDHLCSFTPDILKRILRTCGFEILRTEHQAMFEVLADVWFPSWTGSGRRANRLAKLAYSGLALTVQTVFNLLRRGDLLTIYARKT